MVAPLRPPYTYHTMQLHVAFGSIPNALRRINRSWEGWGMEILRSPWHIYLEHNSMQNHGPKAPRIATKTNSLTYCWGPGRLHFGNLGFLGVLLHIYILTANVGVGLYGNILNSHSSSTRVYILLPATGLRLQVSTAGPRPQLYDKSVQAARYRRRPTEPTLGMEA